MRRALIIEDDYKFRTLLKRLLEKKFHIEVFEAGNGLEGIDIFKEKSPQLIFLDISMPHMDGVECLSKIREVDTATHVVVLSCMSNKDYVQKMLDLGISDYVVKTDFVVGLSERIYDILEKHKIFFN